MPHESLQDTEIPQIPQRQDVLVSFYVSSLSILPDYLSFATLEDLLTAQIVISEGGDIEPFLVRWFGARSGFRSLEAVTEIVRFADLEMFYLPTGIPEGYYLHRIRVYDREVTLWFLRGEHMVSEAAARSATSQGQHFDFTFSRRGPESALYSIGQTVGSMGQIFINEEYRFSSVNRLSWVYNGERFSMWMPSPPIGPTFNHSEPAGVFSERRLAYLLTHLNLSSPEDLLIFTTVQTIDLTDIPALEEMIRQLQENNLSY